MMNKRNKFKLKLIKYGLIVALFAVGIGVSGTQIGWDNLEKFGFEAILEESGKILEEMQEANGASTNKQGTLNQSGDFEVYVFDVGQADSILIRCKNEYMLIDAGNNSDGKKIVNQLENMGVTTLKYLIGTHAHEDHIGGMDDVLKSIKVKNFYMPDKAYTSASYKNVINAASAQGLAPVEPPIGYKFSLGDATCEVMLVNSKAEDLNQTSLVVEVTDGENKFLFMGDAEAENEEKRAWNDVDVLKVGHHGSSSSSSEDFLAQVQPEIAAISVGENNDYGHPHKETLEALTSIDAKIYRTDLAGTIHIVSDGEKYEVETMEIDLDGKE